MFRNVLKFYEVVKCIIEIIDGVVIVVYNV